MKAIQRELKIRLFAGAAELAGKQTINLRLPSSIEAASPAPRQLMTVASLAEALIEQHPELRDIVAASRWALDEEFVALDSTLPETATNVVLIPPVSGG